MTKLGTNGMEAPLGFPVEPYDATHARLESKYGGHQAYVHHAGAWNALAYRFRETRDSRDQFKNLLRAHGAAPGPEGRYHQERALFGSFSAGFAAFELRVPPPLLQF